MYSGRLVGTKRVDLLLRAFSEIAAHRPEWCLIIAGSGPLREQLSTIVGFELRRRVLWTGFLEDPADLAALYHCADALVTPSDYEPWGVVVTEAAAAGLALVASSVVGAAADVVDDGVNGRIFQRGDVNHLTGCLLDVTDPSRIDRMKAASRGVLARWRSASDPVRGLRNALASMGLCAGKPEREIVA
jgi:glycosyltransferase involved in cell wall biosynthesis